MKVTDIYLAYGESWYKTLVDNGIFNIKVDYDKIVNKEDFIDYLKDKNVRIYLYRSNYSTDVENYNTFVCQISSFLSLIPSLDLNIDNLTKLDNNIIIDGNNSIEINPAEIDKNQLEFLINSGKKIHLTSYRKQYLKRVDSISVIDWISCLRYKTIFVLKGNDILHYKNKEVDILRSAEVKFICDKYNIDYNELFTLEKDILLKYTLCVYKELINRVSVSNQLVIGQDSVLLVGCVSCNLRVSCPYANEDNKCVFTIDDIKVKDAKSFESLVLNLLNIQYKRIQKGLINENLSGNILTESLSKEITTFMKMLETIKKLSQKDDNFILIKGKQAESKTILLNFFKGLENKIEQKEEVIENV